MKKTVDHLKPHQFKPGQSGNPAGKPKGYHDFDSALLKRIFGRIASLTETELDKVLKDPLVTVMEKVVAKSIQKAILDGDATRISYLLDRYLPKPKEPPPEVMIDFAAMSTEQLLAMTSEVLGGLLPAEEKRVITIGGTANVVEKQHVERG